MPIRIAHVITDLSAGGAQTMLLKLLSHTDVARFQPTVISLLSGGVVKAPIQALGIPVRSIGMKLDVRLPMSVWRLVKLLRDLKPDLVQGWMVHGNIAAQLAELLTAGQRPVLWNIRHSAGNLRNENRLTVALVRVMARLSFRATRIMYNSRESMLEHQALGYSPDTAVFIPNGFDCNRFCPQPAARSLVRDELCIPQETILIGLSARYHPMKGHSCFCAAAARIVTQDVHFVFMGSGTDRSNSELWALVTTFGLEGRVHLLGERSDVARITAALDIATSSSLGGEGFSNAVGEAMACGVPCVVTDIGASAWIVGDTGRVILPYDSVALAAAWQELLDMGCLKRARLGESARARVLAEFSIARIAVQYERLYMQVLGHDSTANES